MITDGKAGLVMQKIILDCDPGQDDAVALLLALAHPEQLEILGITAVAGNVPLPLTQRNARIMCEIAGRPVPVYAGCEKPLHRELVTAEEVHGRTGIDGIEIFEPSQPVNQQHAVDFIIESLLASGPASVSLVPMGPLTNIAKAISTEPRILRSISEIVLMGGALREGGNATPSAEFNMLVDPEAADTVLRCGRPLVVMSLDVTHQVLATPERIQRIKDTGNAVCDAVAAMLEYFNRFDTNKYGWPGAPLHDPCTVAYLLQPELFAGKPCNVSIETQSPLTLGHTAVDFWEVTERPKNALWIHSVDAAGFFDLLTRSLAQLGDDAV